MAKRSITAALGFVALLAAVPASAADVVLGRASTADGAEFAPALNVRSAIFSPDGGRIITADEEAVTIWSAETGLPLVELCCQRFVYAASFSPDGRFAATATVNASMVIWNARTGQRFSQVEFDRRIGVPHTIEISADGEMIVLVGFDGMMVFFAGAVPPIFISADAGFGDFIAADLSPDGRRILAVSSAADRPRQTLAIFDPFSGASVTGMAAEALFARFVADGSIVATTHTGQILSLSADLATATELRPGQPDHRTFGAVISPDGGRVLTWSRPEEGAAAGTFRLWSAGTGETATLIGADGILTDADFSPTGDRLVLSLGSPDLTEIRTVVWTIAEHL